jgi:hypothetical protein
MPVTYRIDTATKTIRTTCSRPLAFAEVMDHFRCLKEDPTCSGPLNVLLDVSDADLVPQTSQLGAVSAAVSTVRRKVQFQACAIVATRDAMFGMMRMFEVLASDYFTAIRVFRKMDEAEAWLALRQLPADPVP